MSTDPFHRAIRRILRPVVRAMIARGLTYPQLVPMLKELFIDEAEAHFRIDGRRLTDSRISVLTGLQRRDIRQHRSETPRTDPAEGQGPLPRVVARWQSDPIFRDGERPAALPRLAAEDRPDAPSFEGLVQSVGRDVHPRTILDELVRLGMVVHDRETEMVSLTGESFVPSRSESLLIGYYAANLGDHAAAAAANLMAAPAAGPFYERAVHYNKLAPASVDALETLATGLQQEALTRLNEAAQAAQARDAGTPEATLRFRCGAYFYRDTSAPAAPAEDPTPKEAE
ncbi:MAG: DUF6502 family protein [Paracoccaceae bacterium]